MKCTRWLAKRYERQEEIRNERVALSTEYAERFYGLGGIWVLEAIETGTNFGVLREGSLGQQREWERKELAETAANSTNTL